MKIVFFTDSFLPSVSGIVAAITNLTQGLIKKGYKMVVFAPTKRDLTYLELKDNNFNIEFLPSLPSFINPNLRLTSPLSPRMVQKVRKFDPDIIHFHTPFLLGVGAIFLARVLKKPIVATFHSYFMEGEYLGSVGIKDTKKFISKSLWEYARWFYNQCDAVVAPSYVTKADLLKHFKKNNVYVIPNPINETHARIASARSVKRLKQKYRLREKVILYVGRLSGEKNLEYLIRSLKNVVEKFPEVSLCLIGDGPQKKKIVKLINTLQLHRNVVIIGAVSQVDLLSRGYFQMGDIFISPSTSETQGLSIVEAMYFGLPIVGAKKRASEELIKGVGLLCKPDNSSDITTALLKLLTNQKLRTTLSIQSRQAFETKYTLSQILRDYDSLYKTVVARYKRLHAV